ncbi:calcium/sodium antiporter [Candidatus Peregrinibacteria bacterium]|nr:calcium/sodium antiporter [Candidatus Peregrinibacteria bacterium]
MIFISIILYTLGLLATYYLLAKVCDEYFVGSLEKISNRFKLPDDVNGATFMAIGTSAPEFFTAIVALTKIGSENVGVGTIVGSALFNLLVIIGAVSVIKSITLKWQSITRDLIFYAIGLIILLLTFVDGVITLTEASYFLIAYASYLGVLFIWKKWFPKSDFKDELPLIQEQAKELEKKVSKEKSIIGKTLEMLDKALRKTFPDLRRYPRLFGVTFVISIFYIVILSWSLVELAVGLAETLQIPQAIVALTVLAAGTSVPDLLASIFVARKNSGDMAVSNAIASNTFDVMIGIGLPWLTYIIITQQPLTVSNENIYTPIVILLASVIGLFLLMMFNKFKINKLIGYSMIIIYLVFMTYQVTSSLL